MAKLEYNLELSGKEIAMLQLRIMKPMLSWKTIETLYYVWKYPDSHEHEIVKNKLYKNRVTAATTLQMLYDQELLESETVNAFDPESNKKVRKRKKLNANLAKYLTEDSTSIILNLTQK